MPAITQLGQYGIISDVLPHNLPPNAFSGGENVRAYEDSIEKFEGHIDAFAGQDVGRLSIAPYWATSIIQGNDAYWIYAGVNNIYATEGTSHANITRADNPYSMDTDKGWTGGVMGGVVFANNGIDAPQQWVSPADLGTKMTDLSNWPSGAKCQSLRSFKQFMIAMDYTNGAGTNFPRMLKWSNSASFNSVPSTWDETDATQDAGEYEMADTPGRVVDGSELRDAFMIYKEDSVWGAQFIGPPFVFRFYKISESTGAINRRCMAEFPNGHFVFGVNDCYINDGQNLTSVLDQRNRREVFDQLGGGNFAKCFVTPFFIRSEMWACYPSDGATWPNKALVWNWRTNAIGFRDLPEVAFIHQGVAPTVAVGGDSPSWISGTAWDENIGSWDEANTYDPTRAYPLMVSPANQQILIADQSNTFDGIPITSRIERTGMHFGNTSQQKYCKEVYIDMSSTGPVDIYVGGQDAPNAAVVWEGPFVFDPSTQEKIDCRVTNKYLAFKVVSTTDISWSLTSYDMIWTPAGGR
tara:strand:- start:851 stop:2419 length:1569 start_codon:yes stop_codon:yes gene_type:complete